MHPWTCVSRLAGGKESRTPRTDGKAAPRESARCRRACGITWHWHRGSSRVATRSIRYTEHLWAGAASGAAGGAAGGASTAYFPAPAAIALAASLASFSARPLCQFGFQLRNRQARRRLRPTDRMPRGLVRRTDSSPRCRGAFVCACVGDSPTAPPATRPSPTPPARGRRPPWLTAHCVRGGDGGAQGGGSGSARGGGCFVCKRHCGPHCEKRFDSTLTHMTSQEKTERRRRQRRPERHFRDVTRGT